MANDRLHEIMGEIGVLHNQVLQKGLIQDVHLVEDYVEERDFDEDVKEHYYVMLLQYYFAKNDLDNCQKLLLQGIKFEMRMEDIKDAITNIKDDSKNVIEFFDENVVFLQDKNIKKPLVEIYEYYQENKNLQEYLNKPIELIKKNRYVCVFAYKNKEHEIGKFFLNNDLLVSLQKDLPHLFK